MGTVEAKTFLYCWRRRWRRVEHETHAAYAAPPFPTNQTQHERNRHMKLTKADIKQKRAELEDHREARRGGRLAAPLGVAHRYP